MLPEQDFPRPRCTSIGVHPYGFWVISMSYLGNRRRCSVPLRISIILPLAGNSCGRIGTSDLAHRFWNTHDDTKQLPLALALVDNPWGVQLS
jgi:hypothetical protein